VRPAFVVYLLGKRAAMFVGREGERVCVVEVMVMINRFVVRPLVDCGVWCLRQVMHVSLRLICGV